MTIAELIERLEKATGPNARLDTDIMITLGQWPDRNWWSFDYQKHTPANLTSSLDAAVALAEKVLPGWRVSMFIGHLTSAKDGSGARASLQSPRKGRKCPSTGMRWPAVTAECFHAKTAPVALCIAILKAKQASEVAA